MGILRLIDMFKDFHYFLLQFKENGLSFRFGGKKVNSLAESKAKKMELNSNLKMILKDLRHDRAKILEYIEQNGTRVVDSRLLGGEVGLIPPLRGIEALKLNFSVFKKIGFATPALFAVDDSTDIYVLIQQFHKWYFMQNGFRGFDREASKLVERVSDNPSGWAIAQLEPSKITAMRESIAREVESIEFVEQYVNENCGK